MMNDDDDPIVAEVRRIREAHAARFDYDPDAIFADIQEQQRTSGRTYVSVAPIRTSTSPTITGQSPSSSTAEASPAVGPA